MKKYLKLVNKNFSIIISIPPLIGAIWQIINLGSISFSYIRFFSITQLIPDGIIILICMALISISTILLGLISKYEDTKDEVKDNTSYAEVKNPKIIWGVLLLVFCCFFLILLNNINNYFINNLKEYFIVGIIIPANLLLYSILGLLILYGVNHIKPYDLKSSKKIKIFFSIMIVFATLNIIISYFNKFNQLMLFPNNLVNQNIIEKNIEAEFPNSKIRLLYNNDKYLFYSIIDSTNTEKIKIENFEKLFTN